MGTNPLSQDETTGRVQVEARAGVPVVSMIGDFDLGNADQLRACLGWLDTLVCSQVEVDLSETTFIDSTTLGTLVSAHRGGQRVVITGATREPRRALEISGLNAMFAIIGHSPERSTDQAMGPGSSARQARHPGYIEEFGQDRVCAALDCGVVLSRYNSGRRCWTHEQASTRRDLEVAVTASR